MTPHLDRLITGRAPRGTPGRRGPWPRLASLVLIAGLVAIQAGCQSGPFSGCSSCGTCGPVAFLQRTTNRILHRDSGCCGSAAVGGAAVDYSTPSTVVSPPTTTAPLYSTTPGTSTVPLDTPNDLEQAPKTRVVPGPTGAATNPGAGKASYTLRQPATRTATRLESVPADRRATEPSSSGKSTPDQGAGPGDDNPLDHLPPLGLPGEVTSMGTNPPAPSASGPGGQAGDRSPAVPAARNEGIAGDDRVGLSLPADADGAPEADPASAATGIARFASVDLRLAAGSAPSAEGLNWLADKGYRTVLDLRESPEVTPAFIADAARRGLRYVALPVNLKTLDADRLARFQFELAAPEARPLFFFDTDGSRAGALWYVRRVTVDRVDAQLARREAEAIGLKDATAWQAATDYVARLEAAKAHPAPTRTSTLDAADSTEPADDAELAPRTTSSTEAHEGSPPASLTSLTANAGRDSRDHANLDDATARRRDAFADSLIDGQPTNWRPLAYMLLTGLTVPLAYITRSAVPAAIARARASLPAPGQQPRSLPPGSDA